MSRCRSCGAEINWARTASGALMPIEFEAAGTLAVWEGYETGELQCAVGLGPTGDQEQRAVPHFALCPKADQHRRPR